MTATDEFYYSFNILLRIQALKNDIEHPPANTEISRERREAEVQAGMRWIKTGKGNPTTRDKALLKYYPLPKKPVPPKKTMSEEVSKRKVDFPRMLARLLIREYPGATGRSAWNLLPEVLGEDAIAEHLPIPPMENKEIRKLATSTIILGTDKVEITFKAFERAWEREKDDTQDQRQREKAARIKEKEEAEERFAMQSKQSRVGRQ